MLETLLNNTTVLFNKPMVLRVFYFTFNFFSPEMSDIRMCTNKTFTLNCYIVLSFHTCPCLYLLLGSNLFAIDESSWSGCSLHCWCVTLCTGERRWKWSEVWHPALGSTAKHIIKSQPQTKSEWMKELWCYRVFMTRVWMPVPMT